MTKRHLITCSVIVLLVIISAINICGTKASTLTKKTAKIAKPAKVFKSKFIFKNIDDNSPLPTSNCPLSSHSPGNG